ncbi:hypothetical protein A2926_03525 [Candidatus Giovannonibacteria bacterium RIFCSPLOWO2_01_FULL_44_40]|uniref:Alginate lyase domain-containing protein n=1 Tax=Candidatus Giovannonibacteria bacterium RIFCSPHIGHO2_01_FULL_45_23 TaxID=1798325 RepID=A0A1F5VGG9_9BACT|nr:MAG: hypothetical protein A2834_03500 [Candidatus Giovannonibacteria bacterium RIFCSPHIGHO2_01_FULL_45_23]OGF75705.1 MAG: hypothetical protein A3C77_01780 [Candidatus Giovannonibacteria bacterium RIFCSPHIGHO2_02_FULL_45_13]OGF79831.1 MAG: hypothetical protein A2926_03525 [Candidatus Giovannonibacteria bacterium RIFCSPLOWO2_01_FULL_44_40]
MESALELLKKASGALLGVSENDGNIFCAKHKVPHTGKIAYAVILNLELFDAIGEIKYLERAKLYAGFVYSKIKPDPSGKYWIVWPGNHSRYNMSNSSLDAGSGIDALSSLLLHPQNGLSVETAEKYRDAVWKVSSSYLTEAASEKPITNQRLWAGTGLAAAYALFHEEKWKQAVLKGVDRAFREQWADGFFSYHPFPEKSGMPDSARDITSFYHSRHIGFILYSLDRLGIDWRVYETNLSKGIRALIALVGRDGLKSIRAETKRWYWHSFYEAASFSFDLYALLKWSELAGDGLARQYARIMLERLEREQNKDGWILASRAGENFQCKIFWTCQIAWLARVRNLIPQKTDIPQDEYAYFPDADILRVGTPSYLITVRGKTFTPTMSWGSGYGGGNAFYFGKASESFINRYPVRHGEVESGAGFGSWVAEPLSQSFLARIRRVLRLLKNERHELKSHLFYMFVELRARNIRALLHLLAGHFLRRILSAFSSMISTQWSGEVIANVSPREAVYKAVPAARDGEHGDDFILERKYVFGKDTVLVSDRIEVRRPLRYLALIERGGKARVFYPRENDIIAIKYEL